MPIRAHCSSERTPQFTASRPRQRPAAPAVRACGCTLADDEHLAEGEQRKRQAIDGAPSHQDPSVGEHLADAATGREVEHLAEVEPGPNDDPGRMGGSAAARGRGRSRSWREEAGGKGSHQVPIVVTPAAGQPARSRGGSMES
jgi:hypothetical protein